MIDDLARESAVLLCLRLCVWSLAGYANLSRKKRKEKCVHQGTRQQTGKRGIETKSKETSGGERNEPSNPLS